MKSLRHRLPTTTSLMVFEAAGRTLNFTQAAQELHVSQAAISKQVKYLEEYLGFSVFERHGRRVTLSAKGKQLHQKVSASFNYLADAVEEQINTSTSPSITIAANTAMSHYWLSNAINDFYRTHTNCLINIRVLTSDNSRDLLGEAINIAIVYEPGPRIDWQMTPLFSEELFPVASPEYLSKHPFSGHSAEAFQNHNLLDFERIEPNWINWKVWFEQMDLSSETLQISNHFNNYIMLIDAAKRGMGITLGTSYLIDSKLAEGTLCRCSGLSLQSGRSYWLALNQAKPITEETLVLIDWLKRYQALKEQVRAEI